MKTTIWPQAPSQQKTPIPAATSAATAAAAAGKRHKERFKFTSSNKGDAEMSDSDNSNNNIIEIDDRNVSKESNKTFCCGWTSRATKWIVFTSMLLTIIVTAIVFIIFSAKQLDKQGDRCFNHQQFEPPSYKLFATKTSYSTAYSYLNNSDPDHDRSTIGGLPKLFKSSEQVSLKELHNLLKGRGCVPLSFYFIGRHASRYPSEKEIEKLSDHLDAVRKLIDLSLFAPGQPDEQNSRLSSSTGQPEDAENNSINGNKTNFCPNPLAQFRDWPLWSKEQGNMILESGFNETRLIALRFKEIYPELFDGSKASIDLGVTSELRTAQTALAFAMQFQNYDSKASCSLDSLPIDASDRDKASLISNNKCLQNFKEIHYNEKLQFHKACEKFPDRLVVKNSAFQLKAPNRTAFIAESVSTKLGLPQQLDVNQTETLYKLCKYESALSKSSIWCNLFSDGDLKFYDFLNDADDYLNQAMGSTQLRESSCILTSGMIRELIDLNAIKEGSSEKPPRPRAHFYFTHAEVVQRLLAYFAGRTVLDQLYTTTGALKSKLDDKRVPDGRQWRSGLFSPFSANLAFTMYRCPKADQASPSFELVASLNERPFVIDGCPGLICPLNATFLGGLQGRGCFVDEICSQATSFE